MFENKFYENGTANGTLENLWYTLYGVDVNNDLTITVNSTNKSLKGHQLWFIQQYTVGGGFDAGNLSCGEKKFDATADYSQTTANTYANGTTYQSDIFKYLNNDTSNKCDDRAENNTFILDTGISYDKHYKSIISADKYKRTVSETDKTKYDSTEIDVTNNFSSTFWLLNYTELGLAYNRPLVQTSSGDVVKNFSIGKTDGTNVAGLVYGSAWWLRSPCWNSSYADMAIFVCDDGRFAAAEVFGPGIGVRAAFQVQI